jgi:CheY-like chemotaxis protein
MAKDKTILVIDDDIDIVEQVSYIVTSMGHQVTTAFNRQEAEAILETMTVDLAIVDMMMEDMHSGCVLCRHIKQLHPETAVVILTSVADQAELDIPADPAHFHSMLQCDAFVHKPVHPQQLKSLVARLLDQPDQPDHQTMPAQP